MEKGQVVLLIFILGAIVLILAGGTFVTKKYNLSGKLGMSGKIIDSGTYQDEEKLKKEFLVIYTDALEKGKKVYLILGNREEVRVLSYDELYYGKVNLLMQTKDQNMNIEENKYSVTKIIPKSDKVEITINGKDYEFQLKENENVYFIVSEDVE